MSLPTLTGTGRLIEDPELRFAPSGVAVCKVRLAFNSRKLNKQTNEWEDGDSFFINGTVFKQAAENVVETLTKGMEVVVSGRLKTEQWEDRNDGGKRSAPALLIDSIGPSLAYQTAKVAKVARDNGNGNGGQRRQQQTDGDPWASAAPAGGGRSGFEDEPPF